ncbi:hypothetical protein B0T26DRAFT_89360 [Lasiosphaeria miniovina]|uniref:Uncharacterized protein n=1 Tax=Lasiosphaeria miniovina TaxID=1954250 RepID=A0AA40BIR1_9PEZI|nr:uncharacterized protein B0T26DRAFT_89360 [Lasiosphaeria miniovina]KAK0734965.1 hypothetical protein B0T26DRAFT_89360 [Lasiosphaeria miniovina]
MVLVGHRHLLFLSRTWRIDEEFPGSLNSHTELMSFASLVRPFFFLYQRKHQNLYNIFHVITTTGFFLRNVIWVYFMFISSNFYLRDWFYLVLFSWRDVRLFCLATEAHRRILPTMAALHGLVCCVFFRSLLWYQPASERLVLFTPFKG